MSKFHSSMGGIYQGILMELEQYYIELKEQGVLGYMCKESLEAYTKFRQHMCNDDELYRSLVRLIIPYYNLRGSQSGKTYSKQTQETLEKIVMGLHSYAVQEDLPDDEMELLRRHKSPENLHTLLSRLQAI